MKSVFTAILMVSLGLGLQAQIEVDSSLIAMQSNKDIHHYILNTKNEEHRELLKEFAKGSDSLITMTVQNETEIFFEIWVDYRTTDGYNWGEGYTLSKLDGISEMIWHEQPFKSKPVRLDSIREPK